MRIKEFMNALHEQQGKILQHKNGELWRVEGIDYREGKLMLILLTSEPFESPTYQLFIFSKETEDFQELEGKNE